ncbi:hypothetical protein LJR225_002732 [Phenylobacterium sp. LjRoot225]|uniref:hypothetical protein n=1 Tax=Phenylobacterium sp. LjRoot225 TaxID=3342285 RepID=UPI003ECE0F58
MSSFDFPKIIAAAAASTLGVLSLVILAVALLAYGFFKGSGDKVKVGVFAAMLVAAVGFGVSVLRQSQTASAASPPPVAVASAGNTTAPPAATASIAPPATSTPAATSKHDISGTWRDDDGFTYAFKVAGDRFSYEQLQNGFHAGSGEGTIDGRHLSYAYVDDRTHDRGTCAGDLSTEGGRIDGSCGNGKNSWGFKIVR